MVTAHERPAPPKPKLTLKEQVQDLETRLAALERRFAVADGAKDLGGTFHEAQARFRGTL
jgi:hypothetical protein